VPNSIRVSFVAPAVTAFATFAFIGFYAALGPSIVIESLHQTNRAVGGAVIFEMFLVAALAVTATSRLDSRAAMLSGLVLLLPSLLLMVLAQALGSMPVLLAGSALSGASAALGYRGSLQVVNEIAPSDRRAEVVSMYLLACFFGNSVPVIGVGVLTVAVGSVMASAVFACTIAVFAVAALVTGIRYGPADKANVD
jgi:MFS family permease